MKQVLEKMLDGTDMNNVPLSDLAAVQRQLDEVIRARMQVQRNEVLEQVQSTCKEYGFTAKDIWPVKAITYKKLYRDPISGKEWSGRGKTPRWIAGRDRKDFLIPSGVPGASST